MTSPAANRIASQVARGDTPDEIGKVPAALHGAPAVPRPRTLSHTFNPHDIRGDFPILRTTVHGKPLVYLDNAATTQKPQAVIDTLDRYYREQNANIHRGVYTLSQHATDLYEQARKKVQRLLNARDAKEVIFTGGTTHGINLVASSFGRSRLAAGDEIVLSAMEHHSNIVPWQLIAEQTGAVLRVIPFDDRGELILEEYEKLLTARTRIVALVHVSNSLGTVNPVGEMIKLARCKTEGAAVLIDGAQWVAHFPTDVQALDADFYAFSGHKLFGPTGIGALYGKQALLETMPPYQGGGDMISSVTFEKTTYNDLPHKFEAGTPNIAGGIGLGAAIDYVQSIGLEKMAAYEHELLDYAQARLAELHGVRIVGTARHKASVISFVLENVPGPGGAAAFDIHPHDIGTILDGEGIAVRTGHHCCQPVMDRMRVPATARASIAAYNTQDEIDALVAGLQRVIEVFA
jgi:cysteine desulfurase/selenocysteine lyase